MDELLCIGCGVKLQTDDETKEGFVDKNALNRDIIYCKRCYQLKHYGKFNKSYLVKNTISLLKESATPTDLIVLVCDISLCYTPLTETLKEINSFNNVVMVCNRYDLYKDYISIDKAKAFVLKQIKKAKLNIKNIFIINNNINEIFNELDSKSVNKNIYLLGLENAGKTTFVNNILKEVANEKDNVLVNSKYPGTTIDLIKIPLTDNYYLIDSPGVKSNGNLLNYVDLNFIKKINSDNKIKETVYQLNVNQTLIISNVLTITYIKGIKQGLVFYGSSMLSINRCKSENAFKTFNNIIKDLKLKTNNVNSYSDLVSKKIIIDSDYKKDLVIEGLGFFTLRKGIYIIKTLKGVNVFVRDAFI